MIGTDEATLCNAHGCVVIVRRGADRVQEVERYRKLCEHHGISLRHDPQTIRNMVIAAEREFDKWDR